MLNTIPPEEAFAIMERSFPRRCGPETISLDQARGRVLAQPIKSRESIPGFDRSTVDGYAVRASDTFGCSAAIPAVLPLEEEISMGESAARRLAPGTCASIPTGGAVPPGADAVVMLEYTEDYGDGTIGVSKPAAPGANLIFKGDDIRPGDTVLPAGKLLTPQDIGTLAAMGSAEVSVFRRPVVGILSTGDELVPVEAVPEAGQVRDVNSFMLQAMMESAGALARRYDIVPDQETLLLDALDRALRDCDAVLISGGTSAGAKDAARRVIESRGDVLFHGIAMKPGKPTLLGRVEGTPVFGLPGHPAAAFFTARLFVRPLLARLSGRALRSFTVPAVLEEPVSANHGRAQYIGVRLTRREGVWHALPIRSKSGLITSVSASDGYVCIPRDQEGAGAGETVSVTLYTEEPQNDWGEPSCHFTI